MDINIAFCRNLLSALMVDVSKHTTAEQRKKAWVIGNSFGDYEFHGPNEFYWYGGADNAYDARYKGWSAWLRKFHPEA